jgi:hypothetical protein
LAPQYFSRHIEAVERVHLDHDPHVFGIGTVCALDACDCAATCQSGATFR